MILLGIACVTFAGRLTMAGVDLRTMAELIRRRTFEVTMTHARVAQAHQERLP